MHLYVARIITEEETMSSQDTVKKLRQMRLPVIAEQYEIQISDPSYNQLSFEVLNRKLYPSDDCKLYYPI